MSYSIYYKAQFIKVDENSVIPYAEVGDNNVWEMDNKRRAREWTNIRFRDTGFITTNEALLSAIDNIRTSAMQRGEDNTKQYGAGWEYSDKAFGYHEAIAIYGKSTHNTTFGAFKSIFTNGIAQAMTIEEFKERLISFQIVVSNYSHDKIKEAGLEIKPAVTFLSTQHMVDTISEYTEYYKGVATLYITHSGWIEGIIKHRQLERKIKRNVLAKANPKKEIVVNEYYVLKSTSGKYFIKNTRFGYQYGFEVNHMVKAFMTEAQATKYLANTVRTKNDFVVTKVEGKKVFYK